MPTKKLFYLFEKKVAELIAKELIRGKIAFMNENEKSFIEATRLKLLGLPYEFRHLERLKWVGDLILIRNSDT